jgi:hypothetical protein
MNRHNKIQTFLIAIFPVVFLFGIGSIGPVRADFSAGFMAF